MYTYYREIFKFLDILCFQMNKVSPFIKWVGGKSRLIKEIDKHLPHIVKKDEFTYVEPFLGGGAVFFYLISHYKVKKAYLNDKNEYLISLYKDVRDEYNSLCNLLEIIQDEYNLSKDKKEYYLEKRKRFNLIEKSLEKSVLFIFLNKTGFNGMYRENSKGEFNIPFGDMKKPKILNKELLKDVSELLNSHDIEFSSKSFEELIIKDKNAFYYMDPPYRPISKTSSFTDYTKGNFNDDIQIELKKFCDNIHQNENLFLQSNSFSEDNFFQELYDNRNIDNLHVMRTIGADGSKRKKVKEILISNYES